MGYLYIVSYADIINDNRFKIGVTKNSDINKLRSRYKTYGDCIVIAFISLGNTNMFHYETMIKNSLREGRMIHDGSLTEWIRIRYESLVLTIKSVLILNMKIKIHPEHFYIEEPELFVDKRFLEIPSKFRINIIKPTFLYEFEPLINNIYTLLVPPSKLDILDMDKIFLLNDPISMRDYFTKFASYSDPDDFISDVRNIVYSDERSLEHIRPISQDICLDDQNTTSKLLISDNPSTIGIDSKLSNNTLIHDQICLNPRLNYIMNHEFKHVSGSIAKQINRQTRSSLNNNPNLFVKHSIGIKMHDPLKSILPNNMTQKPLVEYDSSIHSKQIKHPMPSKVPDSLRPRPLGNSNQKPLVEYDSSIHSKQIKHPMPSKVPDSPRPRPLGSSKQK